MEPEDDEFEADDVVDCLGELANQLGVIIMCGVTRECDALRIGLPLAPCGGAIPPGVAATSTSGSRASTPTPAA